MKKDEPKKLEKIETPPTRLLNREEYDKIFIPGIPKDVSVLFAIGTNTR